MRPFIFRTLNAFLFMSNLMPTESDQGKGVIVSTLKIKKLQCVQLSPELKVGNLQLSSPLFKRRAKKVNSISTMIMYNC